MPHRKKIRRWLKITALVPALAMSFLDQTAIPVALPTIERDLGANHAMLQWSVNAYVLAMAIFIVGSGKISDRIGHRFTFSLGTLLFAVFSLFCGISPNVGFLICARAFQGMGAALMIHSQAALLTAILPSEKRGKSTTLVVTISSVFMILGPLIGTYVMEIASWRWIFWMNLPIALTGFWLTRKFLPILAPHKQKISLEEALLKSKHPLFKQPSSPNIDPLEPNHFITNAKTDGK
jgi:MFS family permease